MAIDYCETEPRHEEFGRNPWLLPPSLIKFPCDVEPDITEWLCVPALAIGSPNSVGYTVTYDLYEAPLLEVAVLSASDKETFNNLATQWKEETWFLSSVRKRVSHIAYLKIIGLGRPAVHWILEELQREPDYWYPALEAITRTENPAPHADSMNQLREAWLAWGRENGYIE